MYEYVGVCVCTCMHVCSVHESDSAIWKEPEHKENMRSLQESVLGVTLARTHFATCSNLAQTQITTWQPQLLKKGAAGLLVGSGCPLLVSEMLGYLLLPLIQLGRDLDVLGAA